MELRSQVPARTDPTAPPSEPTPEATRTPEATSEAPPSPAPGGRLWRLARHLGRAAPWSLVAAALAYGLLAADIPGADVARFTAYWLLAIVLPGTLIYRALCGSRGNWPEDVGYGAATGLVLEIAAWVGATATGLTSWLRFWPVPVAVAFLTVPALRRHWRTQERRPLPVTWSWWIAAVMIVSSYGVMGQLRAIPLPPVDGILYQDLLYHLSLVRELARPMPFDVPQHVGEPLSYHYLSDAHMASGTLISGVAPVTVLLRLWLVPIMLVGVLIVAALARELSGRIWTGPLAAALTFIGAPLFFGGPQAPLITSPISVYSPSMHYLLPPLMLLTALCVATVRGRTTGGSWPMLFLTAIVCAGAKGSSLPVLIPGVLLALSAAVVVRRRVSWPAAAALGLLLAGLWVGFALFIAGSGGTELQWFSTLQWIEPYRATVGAATRLTVPGTVPPGLAQGDATTWQFALALVIWFMIMQLPLLIGAGALGHRATRTDPAAWLLVGALLAGVGAVWAVFHVNGGQIYFLRTATPLGVLAAVWLLAAVAPGHRAILVICAALAGGGLLAWRLDWTPAEVVPPDPSMSAWLAAMYAPVLRAAVFVLGLVVVWWIVRTVLRSARGHGRSIALAGLLGASLAGGLAAVVPLSQRALVDPPPNPTVRALPGALMAAEMRAAQWLDRNAGANDVLATNVHCLEVRTRPNCDSRAFWVTGLAGRPAVVESWGYDPRSLQAHGRWGWYHSRQPPPDLVRYALNERAFTVPTAADLRVLRDTYGVRWLFADRRAGPVSRRLAEFTTARYVDGPVTIYELPAG